MNAGAATDWITRAASRIVERFPFKPFPQEQIDENATIIEQEHERSISAAVPVDLCELLDQAQEQEKRLRLEVAGQQITIEAQQMVVAALERKVLALKAALQPFAAQAKIIDENDAADGNGPEPDALGFRFRDSYTAISLGDCRRAKEALQ